MLCIGHRGAMGYAPENTLLSFGKAMAMGAPCVELDVYNIDNHLLVIHDEHLERTTNGHGLLFDYSFEELRKLRLPQEQQIPTLDEVISLIRHRIGINIELKGGNTAELVVETIRAHELYKMALVSSFSPHLLQQVRQIDADVKIGVLIADAYSDSCEFDDFIADIQPFSIHLPLESTSDSRVRKYQQMGYRVYVFTVNQPEDIQQMRAFGVDGVFSDFPDRVFALCGGRMSETDVFAGWE